MNGAKRRRINGSKSSIRRKRRFQELERKSFLGVIAVAVFFTLVATIAVYLGINVHEH
jgi:hypothetical protein